MDVLLGILKTNLLGVTFSDLAEIRGIFGAFGKVILGIFTRGDRIRNAF